MTKADKRVGKDKKGQPWTTDLKAGLDGRAYGQSDEEKKAKKAAYNRERYQRNRETILKQQKGYYNDNQQEIRSNRQTYQDDYNSRAETMEYKERWQRDNPDKVAKYNKKWKAKKEKNENNAKKDKKGKKAKKKGPNKTQKNRKRRNRVE